MTAPEALHPVQLRMFMPAHELYEMHSLDTAAFGGNVEDMRNYKRIENSYSKLGDPDRLRREGIRKPVQIVHGDDPEWQHEMANHAIAVANGNHRVMAAYDTDPNMEVPVIHHDQFSDVIGGMREQDRTPW